MENSFNNVYNELTLTAYDTEDVYLLDRLHELHQLIILLETLKKIGNDNIDNIITLNTKNIKRQVIKSIIDLLLTIDNYLINNYNNNLKLSKDIKKALLKIEKEWL